MKLTILRTDPFSRVGRLCELLCLLDIKDTPDDKLHKNQPQTDTCDRVKDCVDPQTGRRFCSYKCRATGKSFNKEGPDCDINPRTVIVTDIPPPPP